MLCKNLQQNNIFFDQTKVVWKGCWLSPTLFNIYISMIWLQRLQDLRPQVLNF